MSPKIRQALSVIIGLLLTVSAVYFIYAGVRAIIRVFLSLNSDLAVAIIAAAATVLVSVISIVLAKVYEARELIKKEHREKKIPVYEELINFMVRILMSSKTGDAPSMQAIMDFMKDFTQKIMVWGSDDVLSAWVEWRRANLNEEKIKPDPASTLFAFEKLILVIRKDLGHKNAQIERGDILTIFINDMDKHLPSNRA